MILIESLPWRADLLIEKCKRLDERVWVRRRRGPVNHLKWKGTRRIKNSNSNQLFR